MGRTAAPLVASGIVFLIFFLFHPVEILAVSLPHTEERLMRMSGYMQGQATLEEAMTAFGRREKRALPTSSLDEFDIEEVVELHNEYRMERPASNMEYMRWNQELADAAQSHTDKCVFEHGTFTWEGQTRSSVGQNMMFVNGIIPDMDYVIGGWVSEQSQYDYDSNRCSGVCGHYTQVVWANSNEVGCGKTFCKEMEWPDAKRTIKNANMFVCNYSPAGNYHGVRPFKTGPACTECKSGNGWCSDGLCNDCNANGGDQTCECNLKCENCGDFKKDDCTCACQRGFRGNNCSSVCEDLKDRCGKSPGWPKFTCTLPSAMATVRHYCPKMCGLCEAATPENPGGCDAVEPVNPGCANVIKCSTNGVWNDQTCKCDCNAGYGGDACQTKCSHTCIDAYTKECHDWKDLCNDAGYKSFMQYTCARTCGICVSC